MIRGEPRRRPKAPSRTGERGDRGARLRSAHRGEEGTVLVLLLGLVGVLVALVAVVTDASAALLARRGMQSVADGAATAAAQQVDESRLRVEGLRTQLPLVPSRVRTAVARYPAPSGTTLVARVEGTTAVIRAERRLRLPLTRRVVVVRASARVQHVVVG